MKFREYQLESYKNIKAHSSDQLRKSDWAMGLAGEAGEVIELIKHNVAHNEQMDVLKLAKELSDVLWYLSAIASDYKLDLGTIAELNIAKLRHRHQGSYNATRSANRHEIEEKFEHTEECRLLTQRLTIDE